MARLQGRDQRIPGRCPVKTEDVARALATDHAASLAQFRENITVADAGALADFFLKQAIWVGVATAVLFALVPWVKRLMGGVR